MPSSFRSLRQPHQQILALDAFADFDADLADGAGTGGGDGGEHLHGSGKAGDMAGQLWLISRHWRSVRNQIEQGTHAELMARAGLYASLAALQFSEVVA